MSVNSRNKTFLPSDTPAPAQVSNSELPDCRTGGSRPRCLTRISRLQNNIGLLDDSLKYMQA